MKTMKKLGLVMMLVAMCCFMVTGCKMMDPERDAVYTFISTDLQTLITMHNDAVEQFNESAQTHKGSSTKLCTELREEVIPAMNETKTYLNGLTYDSIVVVDLMRDFEDIVDKEISALEMMIIALEMNDIDALNNANKLLIENSELFTTYQADVRAVAKEYGIPLSEEE